MIKTTGGPPMNHANGLEGYREDRRRSSDAKPIAMAGEPTPLARTHWGLPTATSRNTAAEEIADDPAKLCMAGRLISWATAGNDVRFEKVAALRQAIEAGTYSISSADLAEKLMSGLRG
jgi:anti-sigma28 factor (negative regulator of flagellin synthesis)